MSSESSSHLRCPLDPQRNSPLMRQEQSYVCNCHCVFPIRNGIAILLPDEAERPAGLTNDNRLPCRRRPRPEKS